MKGINLEKRGLFLSTWADGNGEMCIGINCFITNGILESFDLTCEISIINLGLH